MKRHYGSWASRLFRSGTTLSGSEHRILSLLISELPLQLRGKVERQFESYNLVQREVDKRALNFYRHGVGGLLPVSPILKSDLEVAPLVRLSLKIQGQQELIHAVLTSVGGRAFSVTFSRPVPRESKPADLSIEKV